MSLNLRRPVAAGLACAIATLAASAPAATLAASGHPTTPTFTIPASAHVQGNPNGTQSTNTSTQATTAPTTTTPAATIPTTSTPASAVPPAGTSTGTTVPTTPTATTPATGLPTSTVPTTNGAAAPVSGAKKASASGTHLSTGAIALIAIGALLVLGCLTWAAARALALEPRWSVSLMHSLREAGYRGSATWAEFADWSRLGR
jgi:hypothetical protein